MVERDDTLNRGIASKSRSRRHALPCVAGLGTAVHREQEARQANRNKTLSLCLTTLARLVAIGANSSDSRFSEIELAASPLQVEPTGLLALGGKGSRRSNFQRLGWPARG